MERRLARSGDVAPTKGEVLTTGAIAKLCSVSMQSVIRWIDGGLLKGFRVPGSSARRVLRDDLEKFLVVHGMPPLTSAPATTKLQAIGTELEGLHNWLLGQSINAESWGQLTERIRDLAAFAQDKEKEACSGEPS